MRRMSDEDLRQRVAALESLAADLESAFKKYRRLGNSMTVGHQLLVQPPTPPTKDVNRELSDQLVEVFERVTGQKYAFDGAKDAQAVQRLVRLRFEDREELLARWEQALKLTAYPGTKSIAVFATRVNEYGTAAAKKQPIAAPPAGDPYT